MTTKAQLQQAFDKQQQALLLAQSQLEQFQHVAHRALLALKDMRADLERTLAPCTLSEETGSELAERFERGLNVAVERLVTVERALETNQEVDLTDRLWQPLPSEDDMLSASLETEASS